MLPQKIRLKPGKTPKTAVVPGISGLVAALSMFRGHVRFNSTAQLIQARLAANLEEYFQKTTFLFEKPDHVKELRRVMELVYLRKLPLVAVDVEAYEKRPNIITELGIAIYDPENQWLSAQPHIRTVHIISKENKRLVNSHFVPNNKYKFNGGTSYQIQRQELQEFLQETLNYYFNERQAVLIGHNLGGDIKWLKGHGVTNTAEVPQVDTQRLFHLSRKRGATLRGILQAIDIPHANLHNAANDAYYTLLAAMSYCDPQRREHHDMDKFVSQPKPSKQMKSERKKSKFSEKAQVLLVEPPSVSYHYPASMDDEIDPLLPVEMGEAWLLEDEE